jgi:hypothetical protein
MKRRAAGENAVEGVEMEEADSGRIEGMGRTERGGELLEMEQAAASEMEWKWKR